MDPEAMYAALQDEIGTVLLGNEDIIESLTVALLTEGHVLLEGVPGTAKTTIANLFATATNLNSTRIQMTPDLLPSDITGTHVYQEQTGEFNLQRGPIFTNLAVADEINRATPKTQSALLEAMQEGNVTIEGETLSLPEIFMVIATQNPIEMEGTHALPEAQRDRFSLKLTVDLPDDETERNLMDHFDGQPNLGPSDISAVLTPDDILDARDTVTNVHLDGSVKDYIQELVSATRAHPTIAHGCSPRATLMFMQTVKARAAIHGRSFVTPDDVKALATPVLTHRLVLDTEAELSDYTPSEIVDDILDTVPVPSTDTDLTPPAQPVSSDGGSPSNPDDETE
ncbi:AAA family ATPase [Halorussus salinus]|uniref:AAA family ATPase n=1 Tax=Halorussus salinus TaxID=1364935 RepID=UPI0034A5C966